MRAALRVMIGKGTPEEIVEEAQLFALKEKIDIQKFSDEELKHFLVDHNLGIDCSGLAFHILDAECKATKKTGLKKYIHFTGKSFLRRLITMFRTVENTSVLTLADEKNSQVIDLAEIQPGDVITLINAGLEKNFHHALTIHQVDYQDNLPTILSYTHTLNWRVDGKYDHGVKQGKIEIIDHKKPLLEQKWIENVVTGTENDTFAKSADAERLELRRLRFLT